MTGKPEPFCLRCSDVRLLKLAESDREIAFYECPTCFRQYAQLSGQSLTYRWLHPISLALYGVIFDPEPLGRAQHVAEMLLKKSPEDIAAIVAEIELELQRPTQTVRDILKNVASEEMCRRFLAEVLKSMRSSHRL